MVHIAIHDALNVTAIREGDSDVNPDTAGDPSWTPLQLTYPIPDHDSAHLVEGVAAAQVLRDFFGTDNVPFPRRQHARPRVNSAA